MIEAITTASTVAEDKLSSLIDATGDVPHTPIPHPAYRLESPHGTKQRNVRKYSQILAPPTEYQ